MSDIDFILANDECKKFLEEFIREKLDLIDGLLIVCRVQTPEGEELIECGTVGFNALEILGAFETGKIQLCNGEEVEEGEEE